MLYYDQNECLFVKDTNTGFVPPVSKPSPASPKSNMDNPLFGTQNIPAMGSNSNPGSGSNSGSVPGSAGHFKNELRHGVFEKKKTSASGFEFTLNKDGNPVLRVDSSDGSRIFVPYDQVLEKYYHLDVFGLEGPKDFDADYA